MKKTLFLIVSMLLLANTTFAQLIFMSEWNRITKKNLLLLLCLSLVLAPFAYAQQTVEAYGFRFQVPQSWKIDKEFSKNSHYMDAGNAMFTIEFYAADKLQDLKKKAMKIVYENVGDYYKHTDSMMKARTTQKEVENNGIKFQEYIHNSPPDENGDYTFVKIWVTLNEETNQYVFWGGSTDIKKKAPEEDRSKEIIGILQSITKFTKTVKFEDRNLKPNESIDLTIMFLADETDIEAESKKELKKIKKFLKDNPNIDVTIVGYASKIQAENRLALGKARAQKVMQELINAKIDKARLQAEGSSETGIDKRVKITIDQIR